MKTNVYSRTLFIYLILFTLLSGCRQKNPDYERVRSLAATLTAERQAAINLVGDHTLEEIATELWAIDKASMLAAGTFMMFNGSRDIAIFVAQGGAAANGTPYVYIGTINMVNNAIVDANQVFKNLNIDMNQVRTLEQLKAVLKNNGFSELTATAVPTLLATIRLGLRYMKTAAVAAVDVGSKTITDILVIPVFMLTPEMMYPWCQTGQGCQYIQN